MGAPIVRAYVLIKAARGRTLDVATKIQRVEGVKVADPVTGEYDVIARFEAPDFTVIGATIVEKIQKIDGVVKTVTCLALTR